jgi:hypothetical protein
MIGIDVPIERLRLLFVSNLWNGKTNSFYGRCFRNERDDKLIPEIKISGNDYKEVLLQDFNDSTVFFDVEPARDVIGASDINAKVSIYFAVSLAKLYPLLDRLDATETAYKDVIKLINASSFALSDGNSLTTGFESYSTWDYDKASEDNMHPYHLFKISTTVIYNLNC